MSDKSKVLAQNALDGIEEKEVQPVRVCLSLSVPIVSCKGFNPSFSSFVGVLNPVSSAYYSPNVTDQLHALSVADMVKVGEASAGEIGQDAYDLKPGQHVSKDDFAQPLSETDWADPAQIFESEHEILRTAERRKDDESLEVPDAEKRQERGENESSKGGNSFEEDIVEK